MANRKSKRNEKGFTLVELMIVVAVIGILAAIAIPNFIEYRTGGFIAACKSDSKNAYIAAPGSFLFECDE